MNMTAKKTGAHTFAMVALTALALSALVACGENVAPPQEPSTGEETRARHVPLEGQPNFRDVGGYGTIDGRKVKWGQIYRSGELGQLTDEDVAILHRLELRTVVSFLLPEEIDQHGPDRLPAGTRDVAATINSAHAATLTRQVQESIRAADFEAIPVELNPEFHRILLEDGKEQYAALLREIVDPANRPLAFHCSHGIHRTGTATAILLSALGVPWETIQEDYLLSNDFRREEIDRQLEKARQLAANRQGIPLEDVDMTNVEAFYVLDGSYIDGALERAIAEYGSMEGYIRDGLGLTNEEIDRLREELLE